MPVRIQGPDGPRLGRARWAAYQEQVLQAHLERRTNVRAPLTSDRISHGVKNPLLRAGAHVLDRFSGLVAILDTPRGEIALE